MLAEERFNLIMEQLNRKRTVTVQELCEALNTSESTIPIMAFFLVFCVL